MTSRIVIWAVYAVIGMKCAGEGAFDSLTDIVQLKCHLDQILSTWKDMFQIWINSTENVCEIRVFLDLFWWWKGVNDEIFHDGGDVLY